jgi:glutamate/tyrosine decarboxylase-like PLP-dependent enzyme
MNMELNLRYKNSHDKNMYIFDNRTQIMKMLIDGMHVSDILKRLGVQNYTLSMLFSEKQTSDILGHRDETYFSEEELINQNFNFNFNDLSYDEQQIYLEREKTGVLGRYFTNNDGLHGRREG